MQPILSNNYYVNFNEDAYAKLNKYISDYKPSTLFILVDENTNTNCLPILLQELATSIPLEIIETQHLVWIFGFNYAIHWLKIFEHQSIPAQMDKKSLY